MRKEIRDDDDWEITKGWLKTDGYEYVVRYVQSLKKQINDLNEKIELIEIYYNTKDLRKK